MGDIAEAIINGEQCALCGEEFLEGDHGYPVACKACWTKDCGYQKAVLD
jgi:hypothetical protein